MGVLYIGVSQDISSDYFSRVRKKTTVEEKVLAIIFRNGLRRTITSQIFYFSQVRPLAKYDSSASERESCGARWLLEAQKISCEDRLGLIQWLGFNLATFLLFDLKAMIHQDLSHKETLENWISFHSSSLLSHVRSFLSLPHQHIFLLSVSKHKTQICERFRMDQEKSLKSKLILVTWRCL